MDNSVLFHPSENDTVFKIDGDKTIGSDATCLFYNDNIVFLSKTGFESIVTQNYSSMSMTGQEYFYHNLKTGVTKKISPLIINVMDMELEAESVSFPAKNQFVITYQANDFKNLIEEKIKDEDISDVKKERLTHLSSQISENDKSGHHYRQVELRS